jgi:hypothetical protein|tara:strand:- start:165 stop:857 length:693 start_codon:yes stop_codon:yes gene_type:complete
MVSVREKVFLISGNNFIQRQRALEGIKKRILQDKSATFSVLTLYPKEIDSEDLADKLFTTSFTKKKVVIFKNFQDLPSAARKFIFDNLKKILINNYVIFETEKDSYQLQKNKKITVDSLFSFILKNAASFRVASSRQEASMEDFISGIRKNDLSYALYVLESLFKKGTTDRILGPQIIGILVKKFSYLKDPAKKEKYFKYLWQADRAIKEKGLDTRLVIETLLVKLFGPQ